MYTARDSVAVLSRAPERAMTQKETPGGCGFTQAHLTYGPQRHQHPSCIVMLERRGGRPHTAINKSAAVGGREGGAKLELGMM
jgi:hypothetical protein